jgi:hypothetical protein
MSTSRAGLLAQQARASSASAGDGLGRDGANSREDGEAAIDDPRASGHRWLPGSMPNS